MAKQINLVLEISGMTCGQCEKIIQKALMKQNHVIRAVVSYKTSTAEIVLDSQDTNPDEIISVIKKIGYGASIIKDKKNETSRQIGGIFILLIALYFLISKTIGFNALPAIEGNIGYGMLFVVGLLTSIHCIAMCGGINISQCITQISTQGTNNVYKSSLLYNGGRVISYTIIGAVVGALGSVISFSGASKGIVSIIAGLFMVLMGINLLGVFPNLRKFNVQIPSNVRRVFMGTKGERGPFVVGLLNGFMPCGPLQTMQIYALGTGSAVTGALSMFAFSLGTVPLMFGLGTMGSFLGKHASKNMMKISAVLVIFLGMIMFQRGASLSGLPILGASSQIQNTQTIQTTGIIENETQTLILEVKYNRYPQFTIQKDILTRINFQVAQDQLNRCNDAIFIPEYGIQKQLEVGDNWIEFMPNQTGTFPYSCWMGMIRSQFVVLE